MDYGKMLFYTNNDKMPQTNCLAPPPTTNRVQGTHLTLANCTQLTDPYASYADNFDLSLLPQDCASPTENIPTIVYQYTQDTPLATPPQIKIEQAWTCSAATDEIKQEPLQQPNSALFYEQFNCHRQQQQQQQHLQQQQQQTKCTLNPHLAYRQTTYPSPQSSPAQSDYGFPNSSFAGCYDSLSSSRSSLYPSSPCPSLDAHSIKQELHILPPSPPESNCEVPSPHSSCADIKSEPIDADVETLIDLNSLFEKTFNDLAVNKQQTSPPPQLHQNATLSTLPMATVGQQQQQQQQQDHQLLREFLEDTTFQKKHNLKPLALDTFIGNLEEVRGDIEPVISLALEHAKREADATCAKLQISQDPSVWSVTQVHAWLRSTIAQFKLLPIDDIEAKFNEDGAALILLSEEEFMRRAPEIGSTLHAQLEVWKMAYSDSYQGNGGSLTPLPQQHDGSVATDIGMAVANAMQIQQGMWHAECVPNVRMEAEEESDEEEDVLPTTSAVAVAATNNAAGSSVASATPATEPKRVGAAGGRNGGSHIHLWQFLKELLAAPHVNGTAIRWIDRSKGIFKIEDSVRVAKLWGRRKNRPAMNYDKLSRSIRQYYKKGIMKKTERSQRLVYQFCHPYHL